MHWKLKLAAVEERLAVFFLMGASLIFVGRVIVQDLNFDEHMHIHYLWLFSTGLRPYEDFSCIYPAFGYAFLLPRSNSSRKREAFSSG